MLKIHNICFIDLFNKQFLTPQEMIVTQRHLSSVKDLVSQSFSICFFHSGLWGSWCSSPAVYGWEAGSPWTGRQAIANNHAHTHSHTYGQFRETNGQVFGLWEEARVPGENPRMHGENMQTPCRKTCGQELNPGLSCCKATVLPTAPPCSPLNF
ncbi:hypothetical protein ILYODFUR_015018 [Ilyodon furcidens]|uniref:Uncharacterized protein n=1 Tax=Ilyodon furcidens TaxID=33524 RepID=A0ABV0T835_9TELE